MLSIVAGLVTLTGTIIIALIAWFIAAHRSPGEPASDTMPALYRIRFRYFLILVALLIVCFVASLPMVPYLHGRFGKPDMVVNVTGHMWYWDLERNETHKPVVSIPKGSLVEFDVTSADVNHGFGLYNSAGQLVAQTQAMPGYVNRLRYQFSTRGTYHILCLEYCGAFHQAMFTKIEVQ